jgi:F-type H+-transporting ATPase subunit alpha
MKKIAGTLKLDQPQYRELEAFSKFGSDLDAATLRVLDKGRKNMEILKQNQYSPMKVEHQVAIIYCGVNEFLRSLPINQIKNFENTFLELMEMEHRDILDSIKEGYLTEKIETVLRQVAAEAAKKMKKEAEI